MGLWLAAFGLPMYSGAMLRRPRRCAAGEALRLLQQCRELAPTLPELYAVQGRILKHAGDLEGAAAVACRAESMDLADRCAHVSACLRSKPIKDTPLPASHLV